MVNQMNSEAFGACTNIGECEAVCPKKISIENIALMHFDYLKAVWKQRPRQQAVEAAG
jgi:succinate dehydrogenase / fumarate reductase iron-sulfur subunit